MAPRGAAYTDTGTGNAPTAHQTAANSSAGPGAIPLWNPQTNSLAAGEIRGYTEFVRLPDASQLGDDALRQAQAALRRTPASRAPGASVYDAETAAFLGQAPMADQSPEGVAAQMWAWEGVDNAADYRDVTNGLDFTDFRSARERNADAHEHYEREKDRKISTGKEGVMDATGHINGQAFDSSIADMTFGNKTVGHSGCEAIAVYNTLRDLGLNVSLAGVICEAESGGHMFLGGWGGIMPEKISNLLDDYDVEHTKVEAADLQADADNGTLRPGQIFIASIWNRNSHPLKGIHTFELVYNPAKRFTPWMVYNRFNDERCVRYYPTLASVLVNGTVKGAYYTLYEIGGLK